MIEGFDNRRVTANEAGMPLLDFLADCCGSSKRRAKEALDARRVYVNRQRIWMAKHKLSLGDVVELAPVASRAGSAADALEFLLKREAYCIVDKPAGLLTQGARSVESVARRVLNNDDLQAVHRLDRDTSGALILSSTPECKDRLVDLFRQKALHKEYLAIVIGRCALPRRTVNKSLEGKTAETEVTVVDTARETSLVRCVIKTGRTHQIRRHLESIGHPVAGDKQYGRQKIESPLLRSLPRQMLHASALEFTDPFDNKRVKCRAQLPPDFVQALRKLKLDPKRK